MGTAQKPKETFREGAAEVKEKFRSDMANLSKWTRVRRFVSISPTMPCEYCAGTGTTICSACGGAGKQKVVWNDEEIVCEHCKGQQTETCSECGGRRRVKNIHRKKFLWLFGIGAAGWALVLFQLWGRDVAPEARAKYLNGGGGGGTAMSHFTPRGTRANQPTGPGGAVAQPGSQSGGQPGTQPGGNGANGAQPGVTTPPAGNQGLQPAPGGGIGGPRGGQMSPHG